MKKPILCSVLILLVAASLVIYLRFFRNLFSPQNAFIFPSQIGDYILRTDSVSHYKQNECPPPAENYSTQEGINIKAEIVFYIICTILGAFNDWNSVTNKRIYDYLKNSQYEIGLLVNFGRKLMQYKRVILTNDRKNQKLS